MTGTGATGTGAAPAEHAVTVWRGRPTDDELAALVAVLGALAAARPAPRPVRPGWARPARYRPAGAWTARP